MVDERNTFNITGGTDVFGSDGEKVGSVSGVEGDYMVVSKGFFFPTDYYIPASAIESAGDDGIYLNVTRDDAVNHGWDQVPETGSTWSGTSDASETATASQGDPGRNGEYADPTAGEYAPTGDANLDESIADEPIAGEHAGLGEDSMSTRTAATPGETIDVPVAEEPETVNRRAADRDE